MGKLKKKKKRAPNNTQIDSVMNIPRISKNEIKKFERAIFFSIMCKGLASWKLILRISVTGVYFI